MALLSIIFALGMSVLCLVAWAKIFAKAGYSGWMCLLFLIPLINIIIFLWFAFTTWPVQEKISIEGRQNRFP